MKINIKLKTLKRGKRKQKWNIESLKKDKIPFQRSVEDGTRPSTRLRKDVNQRWIDVKEIILGSAKEQIGYEKKEKIRKSWITEDMTKNMDERSSWKNKNDASHYIHTQY